ncbi:MAG TPA: energy transducer TonB [Verrucomicrobiae bacterium]|nr:energy transducer TonB [Verrucomicrobiae bacterium]
MNIGRTVSKFSLFALLILFVSMPSSISAQSTATKRKVSHKIVPDYPAVARQMNITGKVKIEAVVEPDGHVKSTHAVGGSPLLIQSAERALKNWKFEPGPKETTEVVEFDFTGQQ